MSDPNKGTVQLSLKTVGRAAKAAGNWVWQDLRQMRSFTTGAIVAALLYGGYSCYQDGQQMQAELDSYPDVSAVQQQHDELSSAVSSLQQQQSDIGSALEEAKKALDTVRDAKKDATVALDAARNETTALRDKAAELKNRIAELTAQTEALADAQARYDAMTSKLALVDPSAIDGGVIQQEFRANDVYMNRTINLAAGYIVYESSNAGSYQVWIDQLPTNVREHLEQAAANGTFLQPSMAEVGNQYGIEQVVDWDVGLFLTFNQERDDTIIEVRPLDQLPAYASKMETMWQQAAEKAAAQAEKAEAAEQGAVTEQSVQADNGKGEVKGLSVLFGLLLLLLGVIMIFIALIEEWGGGALIGFASLVASLLLLALA